MSPSVFNLNFATKKQLQNCIWFRFESKKGREMHSVQKPKLRQQCFKNANLDLRMKYSFAFQIHSCMV
jgi:hypothetical protein